jgi:type I restriction enzyme R subunit
MARQMRYAASIAIVIMAETSTFISYKLKNGSDRRGHGRADPAVDRPRVGHKPRSSVTVDWMHRDAARSRMRALVKRILRKYGYPPDLQDAVVQTEVQQAEALSAEWAILAE